LSAAIEGMFLNSELFDHQRGASNKGYKKINMGTLVLSTQNLHLGNANVNLRFEHGMVSPAYKTYRIHDCSIELISEWVKSEKAKRFFYDATTVGASVCRRNVEWDTLYDQHLYLPSLTEQEHLASFLSTLSLRIKKQTELVERLKKYKRGLLDAVFNQKIHVTKDNEEWQECRIGDILKILHGRDYKDYQAPDGEYPVLGTGGIIDHATKYICDWPCVLIGRKGTIDKPQYMDKPFWTVDTLFYSKPESSHNPKFQYYLFQTINWKKYNEASGVPSQSSSTIEGINVYVPNLKTQKNIANLFSQIDKVIDDYSVMLALLQDCKRGLMQQLFI
jgi:type I restriction enzyme S subunit